MSVEWTLVGSLLSRAPQAPTQLPLKDTLAQAAWICLLPLDTLHLNPDLELGGTPQNCFLTKSITVLTQVTELGMRSSSEGRVKERLMLESGPLIEGRCPHPCWPWPRAHSPFCRSNFLLLKSGWHEVRSGPGPQNSLVHPGEVSRHVD